MAPHRSTQGAALLLLAVVSAVGGAALLRLPPWLAPWSKEVAALAWLAGPLLLGFVLGLWHPENKSAIALSSIAISLVTTTVELLQMKSNIWPLAYAALIFWSGIVFLGATIGSRQRLGNRPGAGE